MREQFDARIMLPLVRNKEGCGDIRTQIQVMEIQRDSVSAAEYIEK